MQRHSFLFSAKAVTPRTTELLSQVNIFHFSAFKTTTILIDGKRVKLQLWDTSGQGRFCTIIRSYSRGAQGILLVYDITNKWSFEGINRWLKEVDQVSLGPSVTRFGGLLDFWQLFKAFGNN